MEKSLLSTIKDVFKEIITTKDDSLSSQLGVKKGFFSSIKYLIYVFVVFPLILLKNIINVNYTFYQSIEKLTFAIMFFFSKDSNEILSNNYQRFVNADINNANQTLTADVAGIQSVINYYRAFKAVSMFLFLFIYLGITYIGIHILALVISVIIAKLVAIGAGIAWGGFHGLGFGLLLFVVSLIVLTVFLFLLFGYVAFVGLKLLLLQLNAIIYVEKEDLTDFIINALDFTILKTEEIYGEDTAEVALNAVIENFVLRRDDKVFVDNKRLLEYKNRIEKGI